MIDRWGKTICVGWPAHHIIWLDAALSLAGEQRTSAFLDIAELTGRSFCAVRNKAYAVLQNKLDTLIAERAAVHKSTHAAMVARRDAQRLAKAMPPSSITAPSKARLMGARA